MGDQYPFVHKPSVTKTNSGNGNTDALAQWALLWVVPFVVVMAFYLAVNSLMTFDAWYIVFTLAGVALIGVGLWRCGRWHRLDDVDGLRRPLEAEIGLNFLVNGVPVVIFAVVWQSMIVPVMTDTLSQQWSIVALFAALACAVPATLHFRKRMIDELRDPLHGDSIEVAQTERELDYKRWKDLLDYRGSGKSDERVKQLESELRQTRDELRRARNEKQVMIVK